MSELRDVRLIGIPVLIQTETSEYYDELVREFDYIAASDSAARAHVPGRLRQIHDELQQRFGGFNNLPRQQLADAAVAGTSTLDLTYQVPREAAGACVVLGALFDEADEYCAAGRYFLTLETPKPAAAFRRWFLGEFVNQLAGAAPTSWPDWAATHAPELVEA